MVRPKNSAKASRENGAKASNKGKAKMTVPVLDFNYSKGHLLSEVVTEQVPKLPKGFVAYECELKVHEAIIREQYFANRAPEVEMSNGDKRRENQAVMADALKMVTDSKDCHVSKRISKLKVMAKGPRVTYTFEESAAVPPRDRPRRVRFSV